jgi:hypothetical protein
MADPRIQINSPYHHAHHEDSYVVLYTIRHTHASPAHSNIFWDACSISADPSNCHIDEMLLLRRFCCCASGDIKRPSSGEDDNAADEDDGVRYESYSDDNMKDMDYKESSAGDSGSESENWSAASDSRDASHGESESASDSAYGNLEETGGSYKVLLMEVSMLKEVSFGSKLPSHPAMGIDICIPPLLRNLVYFTQKVHFTGDRKISEVSEGRVGCFPFVDTKVNVLPPDGPTDTTARSKPRLHLRFRFSNSTQQKRCIHEARTFILPPYPPTTFPSTTTDPNLTLPTSEDQCVWPRTGAAAGRAREGVAVYQQRKHKPATPPRDLPIHSQPKHLPYHIRI